jgi:hypothetical protein
MKILLKAIVCVRACVRGMRGCLAAIFTICHSVHVMSGKAFLDFRFAMRLGCEADLFRTIRGPYHTQVGGHL